jgi:hypothetical protein
MSMLAGLLAGWIPAPRIGMSATGASGATGGDRPHDETPLAGQCYRPCPSQCRGYLHYSYKYYKYQFLLHGFEYKRLIFHRTARMGTFFAPHASQADFRVEHQPSKESP